MRNLLLTLVIVLFGTFSFANVESKTIVNLKASSELVGVCKYSITMTITYTDGSTSSSTQTYYTTADNIFHCRSLAQAHADSLNQF